MRVEKRINEIVNRLNRTKVERKPDLKGKLKSLHLLSSVVFALFSFFVSGRTCKHATIKSGVCCCMEKNV